jgi:hypothetical protein
MFLLLTFVAFGAGVNWQGTSAVSVPALLFAVIALLVRSLTLWVSLTGLPLDAKSRMLIVWFGPRALSSLLLVLLPVFAGIPGAEALFPVSALVVLLSVVVHGAMLPVLIRRLGGARPEPVPAQAVAPGQVADGPRGNERITIPEIQQLLDRGERVRLLDVRRDAAYREDNLQAGGAVRVDPDRPVTAASELGLPQDEWLAAYCT